MVLIYFALFESATMIPLVVCEGKHHELEMRFEIDGSSLGAQRRVTSHTGPVDAQRSEALLDGGGARRDPCQGGVRGGGTREWCRCY